MKSVSFTYSTAEQFISSGKVLSYKKQVQEAHNMLHNKTGAGSEFTGWVDLPRDYDKKEFARIKKAAERIDLIPMFSLSSG